MSNKYLFVGVILLLLAGIIAVRLITSPPAARGAYFSTKTAGLPAATPTETVALNDGDTYNLTAGPVVQTIDGHQVRMLAYNGSVPGPVMKVKQGSSITIQFTNNTDVDTTIHPHGVRVDNAFDGVPGVTQSPVKVGESFTYHLTFPDAGVYWYHPHLRQDYAQDLGLYGAFLVEPSDPSYWSPVNREEVLMVDDVLMNDGKIANYATEQVDRVLMGRFGNTMLVNGSTSYSTEATQGEVVRFYITNAANTRTFNLTLPNAKLKLLGADNGKYESETFVDSLLLAPSERAIVDVLFDAAGTYSFEHKTPERTYPLGSVVVSDELVTQSYKSAFQTLRTNADVIASINPFRSLFGRTPDKELVLTVQTAQMPHGAMAGHEGTMMAADKIEWEEQMAMMNANATPENTVWQMVDRATGKANLDIADWNFTVGDKVLVRIVNDATSAHPMQHPIHVHGQRFLVVRTNGVATTNLAWKDTVLVQTGDTVDVLVDMNNPGTWMAHCHISEHPEAGMMLSYTVK